MVPSPPLPQMILLYIIIIILLASNFPQVILPPPIAILMILSVTMESVYLTATDVMTMMTVETIAMKRAVVRS